MKELTDIQFYGYIEFANKVLSLGEKAILKDKDLRELFYTHSLLGRESLNRNKRMVLGKIKKQDDPFDVVFAEEEDIAKAHQDKTFKLTDPIKIQLKEIFSFPEKDRISFNDWLVIVQKSYINKVSDQIIMEKSGNLHLHNKILFDLINIDDLEQGLKKIKFPSNFPYKQVTISIEYKSNKLLQKGVQTWQIFPSFGLVGSIFSEDINALKRLYNIQI